MLRLTFLAVVALSVTGCAIFGVKPIPQRLDEQGQKRVEYGWNHLVSLGPAVEHTALMDAILLSMAWHAGVDRLDMRSEKQVGDVRVVMESHFAREATDEDAFVISFLDAQGHLIRQEVFSSAEIDAAIDLYHTPSGDIENETPAEREQRLARLVERSARLQRAQEIFPAPPEPSQPTEP